MSSREVLGMATSAAGSVLKTGAGAVEVGRPADITLIDMSGLHLQPYRRDPENDRDLLNLIMWCAQPHDVQYAICDGEVVVRDGRLTRMSEDEIRKLALETDARLRPLIK